MEHVDSEHPNDKVRDVMSCFVNNDVGGGGRGR